jgi:cell division septation protein DedD
MKKIFPLVIIRLSVVAGGVFLLAGCAPRATAPPADTATSKAPYDFQKQGKIPPIDPATAHREVDKTNTFEEMPVEHEGIEVENVQPSDMPPPSTNAPDTARTMAGYRVQIFASGSAESAESVRQAAATRLGTPVYVEDVGGSFKVRVGDCATRHDAEALLERCRGAGYGDAWIVASTVLLPERKP